ncbi:Coiled-coil domain-containing protein [Vanrija pseudolonga]|uniref:Coiled-coil domain-containing protein n=1 Tax=Vanrija pseudolonga TaxID=143232 RepID=A0AAF0YC68_9TREE|nr:Coiled-coil domain-containing protein [Vanrija pseudolonga]
MPPNKGGNSKKEAGRARKADAEAAKQDAANKVKEAKEADKWKSGAKGTSKAELEAVKKAELAAKKAERDALLAAEEASAPTKKAAPKAGDKKKKEGTFAKSNGGIAAAFKTDDPLGLRHDEERAVPELSAVGIDQMLEALELANAKTDADAVGAKASLIERHPERRFKAAFKAYVEAEMPKLKEDHPGLRQNQMQEILYKQFQKSPDNPFNQVSVAYNASKDERVDMLNATTRAREAKYRVDND